MAKITDERREKLNEFAEELADQYFGAFCGEQDYALDCVRDDLDDDDAGTVQRNLSKEEKKYVYLRAWDLMKQMLDHRIARRIKFRRGKKSSKTIMARYLVRWHYTDGDGDADNDEFEEVVGALSEADAVRRALLIWRPEWKHDFPEVKIENGDVTFVEPSVHIEPGCNTQLVDDNQNPFCWYSDIHVEYMDNKYWLKHPDSGR